MIDFFIFNVRGALGAIHSDAYMTYKATLRHGAILLYSRFDHEVMNKPRHSLELTETLHNAEKIALSGLFFNEWSAMHPLCV